MHLGAPGHRETGGVLMYIVRRLAGSPLLAQPPQPSIRVLVRSVLSDDDHDNALRAFPDFVGHHFSPTRRKRAWKDKCGCLSPL